MWKPEDQGLQKIKTYEVSDFRPKKICKELLPNLDFAISPKNTRTFTHAHTHTHTF